MKLDLIFKPDQLFFKKLWKWPNQRFLKTKENRYQLHTRSSIENKASQTRWPCQWIRCCTSTYSWTPKQSIRSNLNSLHTFTKETGSFNVIISILCIFHINKFVKLNVNFETKYDNNVIIQVWNFCIWEALLHFNIMHIFAFKHDHKIYCN